MLSSSFYRRARSGRMPVTFAGEPPVRVDLHCHTTVSDGSLSPTDLVRRAAVCGVELLAITDHDSTASWAEACTVNAGLVKPLQLVTGIEFSTLWQGREIHIVGLNFPPGHGSIAALEQRQSQARAERAAAIADKLVKKGVPDALEAVTRIAGGQQIGRPHFAKLLIDRGMVRSMEHAFSKYLRRGKPLYVAPEWCDIPTAVAAIVAAGGVAVLAHPVAYQLSNVQLNELLKLFVEAGGGAIEVASGQHNPGDVNRLADLAIHYKLSASAGSDFHHPGGWLELGKNTRLPEKVVPVWTQWVQEGHA